ARARGGTGPRAARSPARAVAGGERVTHGFSVRELSSRGVGAVRVLALEGSGALERVRALAPGARLEPGRFARVELRTPRGELLDEAIACVDDAEHVELHVHGAPALVERVLDELGGAREREEARTIEERAAELLAGSASEAAARM